MGTWSVQSIRGANQKLDDATNFGTTWKVTYRLKYSPSSFDSFKEPPKMAWDEVIMYNDYGKGEYWRFDGNMYTQKPDSPTMAVWAQRYFRAYLNAHNQPFASWASTPRGYSKLFDKNGQAVPGAKLGTHMGEAAQNKAVQQYLKSHGGILEIQVEDIPSILKPAHGSGKHVERLLVFNCGVEGGMGGRAVGWQHLIVDASKPSGQWTYQFSEGIAGMPALTTTNLKRIPDPTPKSNLLPQGGIW